MDVEDSYEGALRRMQRLEMAGIAMEQPSSVVGDEPAADGGAARMRELEELAVLACDDNERLKRELGVALQELEGVRGEVYGARAEMARAQQELGEARYETEQLRAYIASLEQTLTSAQQAAATAVPQPLATAAPLAAAPQQVLATSSPFESAPPQTFEAASQQAFEAPRAALESPSTFVSPFASDALPEEDYGYPPKSKGKGAFYFFVIAVVGAAVAALCVMRPWDRATAVPIVVEPPTTTSPPPVVTAPPPAPKIEPTVPKVEPTIVKVPPVVAATRTPRTTKVRHERKHAKRHAAKKHGSKTARAAAPSMKDDPLGGTGL